MHSFQRTVTFPSGTQAIVVVMFHIFGRLSRTRVVLVALSLMFSVAPLAWAGSQTVVISQIYGSGGNNGSMLDNDYVDVLNLGSTPVSLNGWPVQYMSSGGSSASGLTASLPNVTLQPGQYFLL